MGSKSVGSLLMIIRFAPISLANYGKPAAGNTTKEVPIVINKSHVKVFL